jgi:hypothetical protein
MFRFTIRDVLWLMVVVGGLGCGWWIEARQRRREAEAHWHQLSEQGDQLELERLRVKFKQGIIDVLNAKEPVDPSTDNRP